MNISNIEYVSNKNMGNPKIGFDDWEVQGLGQGLGNSVIRGLGSKVKASPIQLPGRQFGGL